MSANLNDTLAALTAADVIAWSKVDDDGDHVAVSLHLSYLDASDPSCGYDDAGKAREKQVMEALKSCGYSFLDGGFEDDGSGREWWSFCPAQG
jgi:hypothetical protein